MSMIKNPQEIEILKEGGKMLSQILRELREKCVPGISTKSLDDYAQARMKELGIEPSFLNYRISPSDPGYPAAVCVSMNEEVVHGIPMPDRIIQKGDIVSMDIGAWHKGLCTDMATSVIAGGTDNQEIANLVSNTREGLALGIATIKSGSLISDIGDAIDDYLTPKGYGIVRDLVGHGVGHEVHEDPVIPNYREPRAPEVICRTGMVLAIEPMVTIGDWRVRQLDDGWTIVTKDKKPAAHFELTVTVTDDGYELITPWPDTNE